MFYKLKQKLTRTVMRLTVLHFGTPLSHIHATINNYIPAIYLTCHHHQPTNTHY